MKGLLFSLVLEDGSPENIQPSREEFETWNCLLPDPAYTVQEIYSTRYIGKDAIFKECI